MSDMTLFEGGNSLASSDLFKQLQDTADNLSGGTGGGGDGGGGTGGGLGGGGDGGRVAWQ